MSSYLARLKDALLARTPAPLPVPTLDRDTPASESTLLAQIAGLKLDIGERDNRIGSMQREYAAMEDARNRAATDAGRQQIKVFFKRLTGLLSNLSALADLSDAGQEVAVSDLVQLFRSLENELARAGLERVGAVGQTSGFDPAIHQRMSGGTVHVGTNVIVRIPGYRMSEKVLMKAMVTTREAEG